MKPGLPRAKRLLSLCEQERPLAVCGLPLKVNTGVPSRPARTVVLSITLAGYLLVSPIAFGQNPIPASFMGMNTVKATDFPPLPVGMLGHPPTLAWGWIERSRGQFTWTGFDNYVDDAASRGIDMVLTFGSTPGWAAANPSSCHVSFNVTICTSPPADIQDWIDFVTAVVNHFNGIAAPHIKYYELWNEANAGNFWSGTYSDMVNLAAAAYPIIHTDPSALLLTPSVAGPFGGPRSNDGATWMTNYLDAGGYLYADAASWHGYIAQTGVTPYPMPEQDMTSGCMPFTTCFGSITTKAYTMRAVFDNHGLAGVPMYNTEGSWGNGNVTDPDTQAAWLARWYLLQAGIAASTNLQTAHWYTWGGGAMQTWGDIENDDGTPTEAGVAYATVYNWLVGSTIAEPCGPVSDGGSVWACELTLANGQPAEAVWDTSGGTSSYTPASQYAQYQDLAGNLNPVGADGTIPIEARPVLLMTGLPVCVQWTIRAVRMGPPSRPWRSASDAQMLRTRTRFREIR